MARKTEAKEEEVQTEEEVSEEVANEEGEKYTGGPIPRVSPSEQNKD